MAIKSTYYDGHINHNVVDEAIVYLQSELWYHYKSPLLTLMKHDVLMKYKLRYRNSELEFCMSLLYYLSQQNINYFF